MSETAGRNQRLDATIPVRFADAREFLVEYSSNISMGGVFVRTSSPAAFGTVVRLSLELPGTGQSVPVTGQVAFVLPPDEAARQGKVPGMGVRFARLDPLVSQTLAAYVEGLQKKSRGRVLVVDDDPLILQQLTDALRKYDLNVVSASNAIKALEVTRFGGIDFIISDVQMPRMDGFEFRDNLRGNPKTAKIPFVFLSSSMSEADRQVASELGVEHFLLKPFDEERVVALLRQVMDDGAFDAPPPQPGGGDGNGAAPNAGAPANGAAAGPAPDAAPARPVAAPPGSAEIAYRRFVALGLDTRLTTDKSGVFGQIVFRTEAITDPVSGQRLERAGIYAVGPDRAKPFWPRALSTLPIFPLSEITDAAGLERAIAALFHRRLEHVHGVKQFLDRLGIVNRYEPATMRMLGKIDLGPEPVTFSVRDPKTILLETRGGRPLGATAPLGTRYVDVSTVRSAADVSAAIAEALRRIGAPPTATEPSPATTPSPAPAAEPEQELVLEEKEAPSPLPAPPQEPEQELLLEPSGTPAEPEATAPERDAASVADAAPAVPEPAAATAATPEPAAATAAEPPPAPEPVAEAEERAGEPESAEDETLDWGTTEEDAEPEPPQGEWNDTAVSVPQVPAEHATEDPDPVGAKTVVSVPQLAADDSADALGANAQTVPGSPEPAREAPEPEPATERVALEEPAVASEIAADADAASPPPRIENVPQRADDPAPADDDANAASPAAGESADDAPRPADVGTFLDSIAAAPALPVAEASPAPPASPASPAPAPASDSEAPFAAREATPLVDVAFDASTVVPNPVAPAKAADDPAKAWADEWTGDENQAQPLWTMQPEDLSAKPVPPPDELLVPASARASDAAPSAPAASGGAADQPPDSSNSTVLICNSCGQYYSVGENVEDERLLLMCPACIAKGA